jgi:hypothetical protein
LYAGNPDGVFKSADEEIPGARSLCPMGSSIRTTRTSWLASLGGLMMFATGLLGEALMRTYFESQGPHLRRARDTLQA